MSDVKKFSPEVIALLEQINTMPVKDITDIMFGLHAQESARRLAVLSKDLEGDSLNTIPPLPPGLDINKNPTVTTRLPKKITTKSDLAETMENLKRQYFHDWTNGPTPINQEITISDEYVKLKIAEKTSLSFNDWRNMSVKEREFIFYLVEALSTTETTVKNFPKESITWPLSDTMSWRQKGFFEFRDLHLSFHVHISAFTYAAMGRIERDHVKRVVTEKIAAGNKDILLLSQIQNWDNRTSGTVPLATIPVGMPTEHMNRALSSLQVELCAAILRAASVKEILSVANTFIQNHYS